MARREKHKEDATAKTFHRLMVQRKVKSAIRLLSEPRRGQLLSLDQMVPDNDGESSISVRKTLERKHPPGVSAAIDALLQEKPPETHPVLFDSLNGDKIRQAALHTQGSAGPSGLDALNWRRLCTMYHGASKRLCASLAGVA